MAAARVWADVEGFLEAVVSRHLAWPSPRLVSFADTPSPSVLEHLLNGGGGCSRVTASPPELIVPQVSEQAAFTFRSVKFPMYGHGLAIGETVSLLALSLHPY